MARDRILVVLVLAALVFAQLVAFALGLWHPDGDLVAYIEDHPKSWWAWHMLSGMVFVMTAGSHAALFCWLVPGRGRALAVIGGIVYAAGAASFGGALMAEAATHWYATSPVLDDAQTHDLLTYISDHDFRLVLPIFVGLVLLTVGPIIASVGLWLSAVLKRWVIVVFVLSTVIGNVFGPASIFALAIVVIMCLIVWKGVGERDTEASEQPPAQAA